jgi:hypothetical protein
MLFVQENNAFQPMVVSTILVEYVFFASENGDFINKR